MEKLIDLLFSKDGIDDSRLIRIISYLLNIIISSWIYTLFFGEYEIIDLQNFNEVTSFFLKGRVLLVIICYSIATFSFDFLSMSIFYTYKIYLSKYEKKFGYTDQQVEESGATLYHPVLFDLNGKSYSLGSILQKIGIIIKHIPNTNIVVFDDEAFDFWVEYLKNPHMLMINLINLYEKNIKFICAYFIVNSIFSLPLGLNIFFGIAAVIINIIILGMIFLLPMIEVFVPAYRRLISVSNSRYFWENFVSDSLPKVSEESSENIV